MAPPWTTPAELKARLRRRWESGELLAAHATQRWEPVVVPLRAPTAAETAGDFGAAQEWLTAWQGLDPALVTLAWKRVGGRLLGSNEVPYRAVLERPDQVWALLHVRRQVEAFTTRLEATRAVAPALAQWMLTEPMRVLANEQDWSRLVEVVLWIDRNAGADRYLRHIDIPGVDTKFIEHHRTVLARMLDLQLAPDRISSGRPPSRFAERYGFRTKPAYVRLRALDVPVPTAFGPFSEVTVRVEELAAVAVEAARVIIVENETTYLALPPLPGTVAVFGGGYAAPALAPLTWLREREIVYWGDIDTHGFAILDRLREAFPHAASVLMDEETLLRHREHWGREQTQVASELAHLTPAEASLYEALIDGSFAPALRLEQERIRFGDVRRKLAADG